MKLTWEDVRVEPPLVIAVVECDVQPGEPVRIVYGLKAHADGASYRVLLEGPGSGTIATRVDGKLRSAFRVGGTARGAGLLKGRLAPRFRADRPFEGWRMRPMVSNSRYFDLGPDRIWLALRCCTGRSSDVGWLTPVTRGVTWSCDLAEHTIRLDGRLRADVPLRQLPQPVWCFYLTWQPAQS